MDVKVCKFCDQFVMIEWFYCFYNGMYFFFECEFFENFFVYFQENVIGEVCMLVYKGVVYVFGCKLDVSNFYLQEDVFMDFFEGFFFMDIFGFIVIQVICLEKYGFQKIKDGKFFIK